MPEPKLKRPSLSAINPLKNPGIRKLTPPNVFTVNRAPTTNDFLNRQIGDIWIDRSTSPREVYMLVKKEKRVGTWLNFPRTGLLTALRADDGNEADPAVDNIINIAGGTGITTSAAILNTLTVTLDTPVSPTNGGTGLTAVLNHSLVVGSGAAAMTELGVAVNGQIPIGSAGLDPVLANITGTGAITVTNGAGTISIGGGGTIWNVITVNLNPMINYNGYICNKAGLLTLTLPTVAATGTTLRVTGMNTALGWSIAQNAGQQVHFGNLSTTAGVGGSISSTLTRDSIELVRVVENLEWGVISAIGNLTVV